jgi:hypothetical protein
MSYQGMKRDQSNAQLMDYTQLLFRNIAAIQECTAYNMYGRIPGLVDELETLLYAYRDDDYFKAIQSINDIKTPELNRTENTPQNRRLIDKYMQDSKTKTKYRALMELMYRKNFIPLKGSVGVNTGGVDHV